MKAWIVFDAYGEYGSEIVYAETRGRAKSLCMNDDTFDDCDFRTLRARRFKDYDQYYTGEAKPDFWFDEEHRVRLVRDYGWHCFDGYGGYCEQCPAKEWCE